MQKEATDVFFSVTKLYQSKDANLRRMVFLMIKEVCLGGACACCTAPELACQSAMAHGRPVCNSRSCTPWVGLPLGYEAPSHLRLPCMQVCPDPSNVIIIVSSLMKDMNSKTELYRSNAIRVLCSITDSQILAQIDRYLKQACLSSSSALPLQLPGGCSARLPAGAAPCRGPAAAVCCRCSAGAGAQAVVDKSPVVASAVLVSAMHLLSGNQELVKRWTDGIQEAVQSKSPMVRARTALLQSLREQGASSQRQCAAAAEGSGGKGTPACQDPQQHGAACSLHHAPAAMTPALAAAGAVPRCGAAARPARWRPAGRQQAGGRADQGRRLWAVWRRGQVPPGAVPPRALRGPGAPPEVTGRGCLLGVPLCQTPGRCRRAGALLGEHGQRQLWLGRGWPVLPRCMLGRSMLCCHQLHGLAARVNGRSAPCTTCTVCRTICCSWPARGQPADSGSLGQVIKDSGAAAGSEPRPFFDFLEGCLRHKVGLRPAITLHQPAGRWCSGVTPAPQPVHSAGEAQPLELACTSVDWAVGLVQAEMVIFEAARAICNLKDVTSRELTPAVTLLQLFLSSNKPVVRFAAVRTLNKVPALPH